MITLPSEGRWKVVNNGDKFGSVIRTKNLSFDKDGALALAKKAFVIYSKDDDAGFRTPIAIETDGTYLYIATTGGHLFRTTLTNDGLFLDEANATNQPTLGMSSDMVLFNDTIVATGDDDLNYLNALGVGQVWHSPKPITDLNTAYPHPLCVRDRAQTLLVGDGNVVRQYSTAYSRDTSNELTIPAQYIITCIRTVGSTIYVGTRHKYGGEAKLFLWTGSGLNNNAEYGCGADWIYSMVEYKSSVAVITSKGQLRRFSGGGFEDLAQLPVYATPYSWTSIAADTSLVGKVSSRGMCVSGDRVYMNIDGSLNSPSTVFPGTYIPEQPSGLWCYDPNVGLYHVAGYNNNSNLQLYIDSINSDYVTFSENHQALTGDAVLNLGAAGGMTSGQVYYAIVDSPTTLRVALSPAEAEEGAYIPLTDSVSVGVDRMRFDRYESMGQTAISSPGGIALFGRNFPNAFYGSQLIFGGATIDETMTEKGMVMSLGMGRNRGYFVTPKIPARGIKDTLEKIVAMIDSLTLNTDSIVIKWRKFTTKGFPTPLAFSGSATWTSSTTFEVDTLTKAFSEAQVGDEIEVVKGAAGGYSANITNIDDATSTYVVTIDEEMPVSTGEFDFVVDNWQRLGADITNENFPTIAYDNFAEKTVDGAASWVQFKVELRGRNVMIDEMKSVNAPLKK